MKIDTKTIIIGILAIFLIINFVIKENAENKEMIVKVPEIVEVTDTIEIEKIIIKKVYIKGDKEYVVDSKYLQLYNDTKSELKKLQLYVEAIAINETTLTLVDNDTIKIEVTSKNRGKLLNQFANYKIKERSIGYTSKPRVQMPRFRLLGGIENSVPIMIDGKFSASVNLMFQNKKADIIKVGYGTDQNINLGYYKSIFKIK